MAKLAFEALRTLAGDDVDGLWSAGGFLWVMMGDGSNYDYWRYDPRTKRWTEIVSGSTLSGSTSTYLVDIVEWQGAIYGLGDSVGEIFRLVDGAWSEVYQAGAALVAWKSLAAYRGELFILGVGETEVIDDKFNGRNFTAQRNAEYADIWYGRLRGVTTQTSAGNIATVEWDGTTWQFVSADDTGAALSNSSTLDFHVARYEHQPRMLNPNFNGSLTGWSNIAGYKPIANVNWTYSSGGGETYATTGAISTNSDNVKTLGQEYVVREGEEIKIKVRAKNAGATNIQSKELNILGNNLGTWEILHTWNVTEDWVDYEFTLKSEKYYVQLGINPEPIFGYSCNLQVAYFSIETIGTTTIKEVYFESFVDGANDEIWTSDGVTFQKIYNETAATYTERDICSVQDAMFLSRGTDTLKYNISSGDWTGSLLASVTAKWMASIGDKLFLGNDATAVVYQYYAPDNGNIWVSKACPIAFNYYETSPIYVDEDSVYETCYEHAFEYGDKIVVQVLYNGAGTLTLRSTDTDDLGTIYGDMEMVSVGDNYYQASLDVNYATPSYFKVQVIEQDATSPPVETVLLESQTLKAIAVVPESKMISYHNNSDFAGIKYGNIGSRFSTRIRLQDWKYTNPQEKSSFTLSNGQVINLKQRVRKQRQLQTDYMPLYMHEKLALIFSHDTVTIDGKDYVVEDSYSYEAIDRYALTTGTATLTERTYEEENIY